MRPKRWGAGRPSLRETLERNNAADRFYAGLAGVAPRAQAVIPPKRERKPADPERRTESHVNRDIARSVDKLNNVALWRNNRGVTQYGNQIVTYGVGPRGAADWIGYRVLTITPAMVGCDIAQFVAIEAKRPGERARPEQQAFLDTVRQDGGCAAVATSGEEAASILSR